MPSLRLESHITRRAMPAANPANTMIDEMEAPSFSDTLPATRLTTATRRAKTDSSVTTKEASRPLEARKFDE